MDAGLSRTPGDNIVGTVGQDPANFVQTNLIATNTDLCFAAQIFVFASSLTSTANGIQITGAGAGTVFKPASGTFNVLTLDGTDINVHSLSIDTSTMTGGYAILLGHNVQSNRFHLWNLNIQVGSTTGGILLDILSGVGFVYGSRIQSVLAPTSNALITRGADQHIFDNDIGGFGGGATIQCDECTDVEMNNNQLYVGLAGVDLYLPKEVRFVGNHCGFFQTECIRLHADLSGLWKSVTISGNVFDGQGTNAGFGKPWDIHIYASGAGLGKLSDISITGNTFSAAGTGKAGINLENSVTNMTVVGNTFDSITPIIGAGIATSTNLQICCNAGIGNTSPVTDYTTGLSLWWKFDEGTGTSLTDSSGNGKTGTTTSVTWSSCKLNDCIYVGSAGFGQIASGFTIAASYTISLWIFINATTYGSVNQFIFGQLQSGANTGILVWLTNTQTITFRMVNVALASQTCVETPIFQNNAWNLLTLGFNSTSNAMSILVNRNTLSGTCTFSGSLPTYNGNLEVGDAPSQSPGIKAYIDDFRIYNTILTQSNINQIYQFGISGQTP